MAGTSAGTGAGIGIALGLLVLLIAGPGAYYYRKRRRQQLTTSRPETRDVEIHGGEVDYFGGVKPQLDDTAVSQQDGWRISRSTMDDGARPISELAEARARGIDLRHPTVLRPGPKGPTVQELTTSDEHRRPELQAGSTSPPVVELRTDKSPPIDPMTKENTQAIATFPVESQPALAKSEESIQAPALPGPLLPPKRL